MDELRTAAETPADFGKGEAGAVRRFMAEIEAYNKETETWRKRGDKLTKRYLSEQSDAFDGTDPTFNILWSNVETLKPAVYANTPKPEVSRRFKDRDPVARLASMILERALSFAVDAYDFDGIMKDAVHDRLLPGRGTAWVRYEYEEPDEFGQGGYEKATCDYVHWKDFGHTPARVWGEVESVWRRVFLTREELVRRFGEEVGKAVPLDHKPKESEARDDGGPEHQVYAKATVYELWHKPTKQVFWIAKGYKDGFLDRRPAPLDLQGFFPCPRPMLATTSTDSLIPVPDFVLYQDQAEELDRLTTRIHDLQDALKVVGVYDSSMEGVQRLLNEGVSNELIPVDNWAGFAQAGGLQGSVDFMPLDQVVNALQAAYQAREAVKAELYEITGISDILRGQSDSQETATAQGIKAQWGSLRVREKQKEVARFARDLMRLKGEIIAEMFSPETLAEMVNVQELLEDPQLPPPPQGVPPQVAQQMQAQQAQQIQQQQFMAAIQLLRNDRLRGFRVDIETDSTIEPNEQAEKQSRVEFIQAAGGFLKQALEVVQVSPEMTPMMAEMMLFGVRGFRAGRQMEAVIEQSLEQAAQASQQRMQQAQNQPPPEIVKAQMQAQAKEKEIQGNMRLKASEQQTDAAMKARENQTDAALEAQRAQQDAALTIRQQNLDFLAKTRGQALDAVAAQMKGQSDGRSA